MRGLLRRLLLPDGLADPYAVYAELREREASGLPLGRVVVRHDQASEVLTSHYLEEVESLAERVVVIDHGQVIADGSVGEVRGLVGLKRVAFTSPALPQLPGVTSTEQDGDRTRLLTNDADQLVRDLVASGAPFSDLEIQAASLEDAFLAITAG